jgi:hypothetical protein
VHCTYEFERTGKKYRYGLYTKYVSVSRQHSVERSFDYFKHIYEGMSTEYNVISRNCADWAKQFYERIDDSSDDSSDNLSDKMFGKVVDHLLDHLFDHSDSDSDSD